MTGTLVKLQLSKENPPYAFCAISVTLQKLARGAGMATSLPFSDVGKWGFTLLRVFELLWRNTICILFLRENEYFALPM